MQSVSGKIVVESIRISFGESESPFVTCRAFISILNHTDCNKSQSTLANTFVHCPHKEMCQIFTVVRKKKFINRIKERNKIRIKILVFDRHYGHQLFGEMTSIYNHQGHLLKSKILPKKKEKERKGCKKQNGSIAMC